MTLTELRYIVAVARERHFGRAAKACFVSQPTLSVAVRKLENELGVALFERRTPAVAVTQAGEAIVAQAQRVLEEAALIEQLASEERDELKGPLRVGLIYTVGPYVLPELITLLRERVPLMPLVIEEGYTDTLRKRLASGELDLIVISLPLEKPGVVTRPMYDEPFVVLLPASHPWTQRETVKAADLASENLLLLGPGHCFRDQVLAACPDCQPTGTVEGEFQVSLEGSSLETMRHMVVSGIGITVVPCTAAGADRYSQRLLAIRRFSPPAPGRRVALAWRKSFPRPKAAQCVLDAVAACRLSGVQKIHDA
jgi:LysR family hydrogen peroxide-inducible transcriptional activator